MKRLGFTIQVPRPTHKEAASPKEQGAFIKKSRRR
ncbi:winged helix-turn-helix domain-containing protein [Deinococcus hopiensis]